MSTSKSGGRASQGTPRKGNRLGIKKSGGQTVKTGQILIRQRGSHFHPSEGTSMGRDFTIFAMKDGITEFFRHLGKNLVRIK